MIRLTKKQKINRGLRHLISFLSVFLILTLFSPAVLAQPFTRTEDEFIYSWHKNSSNKIALTFDDGPDPTYTEEILSILDEYSIPATFFIIGSSAQTYPDIIKKEIDSGHEIGNHTFSHIDMKRARYSTICNELTKTDNLLYEIGEYKTRLLRPPGGKYSKQLKSIAENYEYSMVLWTIDTKDWAHTNSEKIYENVIKSIKSGDIILFHDHVAGKSPTPEALRLVIPELINMGYNFVTVSELIHSN